jgi:hypothetical protein
MYSPSTFNCICHQQYFQKDCQSHFMVKHDTLSNKTVNKHSLKPPCYSTFYKGYTRFTIQHKNCETYIKWLLCCTCTYDILMQVTTEIKHKHTGRREWVWLPIVSDWPEVYENVSHSRLERCNCTEILTRVTCTLPFSYLSIPGAPTWSIGHPWNASFRFSFLI